MGEELTEPSAFSMVGVVVYDQVLSPMNNVAQVTPKLTARHG